MITLPISVSEKHRSKIIYHLLFWSTLILSFSFENISLYEQLGIQNYILLIVGRILTIGTVIYLNIRYAIPLLFRKKKYAWYVISVIFSIALLMLLTSTFNYLAGLSANIFSVEKSILVAYIFSGLRILFLSYLLYISMEWIDQKFWMKEMEIEKLNAENKYLKNQLNPHLLFNTLNNLHGLVLTNKELASESLLHFSDLLKYIVYESEHKTVALNKEIQLVKDYLSLEGLRLTKNKKIELTIDLEDKIYEVAPLMILPIVENAVKHGFYASVRDPFINISIKTVNGELYVDVVNKRNVSNKKSTGGIGIKNLKRRLQLEYPGTYTLNINEEQELFVVHLKLTLNEI